MDETFRKIQRRVDQMALDEQAARLRAVARLQQAIRDIGSGANVGIRKPDARARLMEDASAGGAPTKAVSGSISHDHVESECRIATSGAPRTSPHRLTQAEVRVSRAYLANRAAGRTRRSFCRQPDLHALSAANICAASPELSTDPGLQSSSTVSAQDQALRAEARVSRAAFANFAAGRALPRCSTAATEHGIPIQPSDARFHVPYRASLARQSSNGAQIDPLAGGQLLKLEIQVSHALDAEIRTTQAELKTLEEGLNRAYERRSKHSGRSSPGSKSPASAERHPRHSFGFDKNQCKS